MSKWEWKKLGEVCDSINGLWKGKKEPFIKVGVIRNTNFTKNCKLDLNPSKLEFLDVEKKQYDKRKLQFGDLIVEKSGGSEKQPVGRVVLFEEKEGEYSFSNFTSVLRIKNDDEIECHFLHLQLYKLYLDGVTKRMQSATTGIHNLDFDQFKDLSIGIPPLSEQKRIVKFLDEEFSKIETLKTNAETNLKNAKELFESTLEKELNPGKNGTLPSGWEWIKISTLVTKCLNIKWDKIALNDSRLYIDLSSVNKDTQCIENVSEINVENAPSRAKQIIHEKDVLFATTRPTQKRVCIVEREFDNQICSTGFCVLRPQARLESKYLFYCLLSDDYYSYIKPLEKGANYPAVTDGDVKNYEIPLPPLSVQKEIVARLDKLSENVKRLEANYKQIIADCDELKKSILKKTFEGES